MTHNPIIIKDVKSPIRNTRQVLLDEKAHLIKQQFTFKRFRTEKERIAELMKEKHEQDEFDKRRMDKNNSNGQSILQPTMRFKPRTDLERVFQAANEYSYGRIKKDVIDQHLNALNLNTIKRNSSINFLKLLESRPNSGRSDSKNQSASTLPPLDMDTSVDKTKLYENPKRIREHLRQANLDARRMMDDEFHVKTHFKAAANISLKLEDVMNKPVSELLKEKGFKYVSTSSPGLNRNVNTTTESDEDVDHKTRIERLNKIPHRGGIENQPKKEDMQFLKQLYMSDHLLNATELKKKKINFYTIFKKQNRGSLFRNDPVLFFENYSNNTLDIPAQQKSNIILTSSG
jgi:hypothetical protein